MQKVISIGDINLMVSADHEPFWPLVQRRYTNFLSDNGRKVQERISLEVIKDAQFPGHAANLTEIQFLEETNCVRITRGNGIALWDRARHHCHIQQAARDFSPDKQHADYVFGSVLRIMLSVLLLESRGCLIHSAGIVRDGRGYLFVGQSGAGKSTISRLSQGHGLVLSDDLNLLKFHEGEARIYGTPFYGEFLSYANERAPLAAIYFLQQSNENRILEIGLKDSLVWLLQSIMYFEQEKEQTVKVLQLAQDICANIPCYILQFKKEDSFWRLVDG